MLAWKGGVVKEDMGGAEDHLAGGASKGMLEQTKLYQSDSQRPDVRLCGVGWGGGVSWAGCARGVDVTSSYYEVAQPPTWRQRA